MTDEELKELVAETSRQVRELRGSQQALSTALSDLARSQERSEKELTETFRDLARSQEKSERGLEETFRDLAESQKRTGKMLGELGNRFGGFTEGMALPSIREILYNQFGVDAVNTDVRARRNGHSLQIDAVGLANGEASKVYLVEIKSRLREESLQQLFKHLQSYTDFFPDHRGRTLYGMLAAVDVSEELEKRVLKEGIYLAKIHGDLFELAVPDGFEPRGFPT